MSERFAGVMKIYTAVQTSQFKCILFVHIFYNSKMQCEPRSEFLELPMPEFALSCQSDMTERTSSHSGRKQPKRLTVGFVLARHFTLSAFALFVDTLRLASDDLDNSGRKHLDWQVLSENSQLIKSSCGVFVAPTARLNELDAFDYLVIVGGRLHIDAPLDDALTEYLKRAAAKGKPVIGLCTASFILADAGLLKNKLACVSWLHRAQFQERFPEIDLASHQLFVEDGAITTCAGGTAVADLAAHIVKKHIGLHAAKNAMDILQIDRPRKGNDIQSRMPLHMPPSRDSRVKRALVHMEEAVSEKFDIERVSQLAGISARQLERLFKKELASSPRSVFERIRLEKAKMHIETSDRSMMSIAGDCGYDSQSSFSRAFKIHFGMTPLKARARTLA